MPEGPGGGGLLATKLRPPALPPARIERPHLLQRLNEGLAKGRKMTLVSAPPGFGKSFCITEWVQRLKIPVAWLSLDPADDDPARFFTYFIAALQRVEASTGGELVGLLRAGQLPPGEVIGTTIVNDLLFAERRFVIVLDDLQYVQDARIMDVLEQLLDYLPPPLHLILISREDPPLPLARLRANNQMTEVRAADLRFTGSEVARLLNGVMDLSLGPAEIAALEERTEGWIAGLHLAGLSMRGRADPAAFIARLSGSHRYILDYLTEEVLDRQPEELRRFLLRTSILDRLSGPLCNAVTGRSDGAATLEKLFTANLFLIPLDDQGRWYRYHQLFADLLHDQLVAHYRDEIAGLHRRASRWYDQAANREALRPGERVTFVEAAVRHALAARDYALAVQLIESYTTEMLAQWHAKMVQRWMEALPPEWSEQSPKATLAFAQLHLMRGDYAQAAPYLDRLEAIFSDPSVGADDPALEAQWRAHQAIVLNARGEPDQALELAQQALKIVPEQDGYVRSQIYAQMVKAYEQMDDPTRAMEAYEMLIHEGQTANNLIFELLGISGLALMAIEQGRLHFAFEIVSRGIARMESSGTLPPISIGLYGELGQIYYDWHRLDEAHRYFRRAVEVSALSGFSDAALYHHVILSRLYHLRGDLDAADEELRRALDLMWVEAPAAVREEVVAQQIRLYLAQDRLAAAKRALRKEGVFLDEISVPHQVPQRPLTYPAGRLYNSALRILLHQGRTAGERECLERGLTLAGDLIEMAQQRHYLPLVLETLLLRAQIHGALGDRERSMEDYLRALELAESEKFVSLFVEQGAPVAATFTLLVEHHRLKNDRQVEHARTVLDAFAESQIQPSLVPTEEADLIEPLTDRELDVLHLIAEGLKYREVADRLFVSLNTVRSHVKAIYGKLGVNSRTQAVKRAKELNVL